MRGCNDCFGTGEIERTLSRPGSDETAPETCPSCHGSGKVPGEGPTMRCIYDRDGKVSIVGITASTIGVLYGLVNAENANTKPGKEPRLPPLAMFLSEIWDYLYADYETKGSPKNPYTNSSAINPEHLFETDRLWERHDRGALYQEGGIYHRQSPCVDCGNLRKDCVCND